MEQNISWLASLKAKLGGTTFALLALLLMLVMTNAYALNRLETEINTIATLGQQRTGYRMLYQVHRLYPGSLTQAEHDQAREELRRLVEATGDLEDSLNQQTKDALGGTSAAAANVEERQRLWEGRLRPLLQRIIAAPADADMSAVRTAADAFLREYAGMVERGIELREAAGLERVTFTKWMQILFSAAVVGLLLLILWVSRNIVHRTSGLAATARRIQAGDLEVVAPVAGRDELAILGSSFNAMTAQLRERIEAERQGRQQLENVLEAIKETTNSLSSASAEILASTTQQASGMREQSSAVAETVTTVDEVLQTAEQAAGRANAVSETSRRAAEVSSAGRKAVEDTVASMMKVQDNSNAIADGVLKLAEHGQEISEIIATVTDVADQTNLLAVNASIEATRGGENAQAFTVVANEIKDLSDQSKKATTQIRRILSEIQKATHAAVLSTEQGTRSVDDALKTINQGGETIRALEETIIESARAASQIAASTAQQSAGMAQIQQAMSHINEASSQNLAATRQTEQAARDLNELGGRLKTLLAGHER